MLGDTIEEINNKKKEFLIIEIKLIKHIQQEFCDINFQYRQLIFAENNDFESLTNYQLESWLIGAHVITNIHMVEQKQDKEQRQPT